MISLESVIIPPRNDKFFIDNQGKYFRKKDYKYYCKKSKVVLRSQDECFWHYFLSIFGFAHTYEPVLVFYIQQKGKYRKKRFRMAPDFGIGNNFLLEVGGMADFKGRNEGYVDRLAEKRKVANSRGYNFIEVYKENQFINGINADHVSIFDLVKKYNPKARNPKNSRRLAFERIKSGEPLPVNYQSNTLFLNEKDREYLKNLEKRIEFILI